MVTAAQRRENMKKELGTMSTSATKVSANLRRPCGGSKAPVVVNTRRPSVLPAAGQSRAPRCNHVEMLRAKAMSTSSVPTPKATRVVREVLAGTADTYREIGREDINDAGIMGPNWVAVIGGSRELKSGIARHGGAAVSRRRGLHPKAVPHHSLMPNTSSSPAVRTGWRLTPPSIVRADSRPRVQ
jgi:hypothetical protein